MSDHDHPDPLTFAVTVFDAWREQRATAGARVPPPLRRIACRLLDTEPLALVARSLKMAEATLRRWRARGDAQLALGSAEESTTAGAFVPLPAPHERARAPAGATLSGAFATLIVERTDGVRLHLGGPIDIATVTALIAGAAPR